ncbi:WD40 repeat domain-containing protein [Leptolyngbya cf. ectocarpi LEGE 11479]|uniref:WD40 repeat domain-containing protein n=1 Tax=Leptolyngbya cf. ectocarpi LEGE 11479 TaxID=1828722 RepID=A0A928ZXG3_LEPEC|nr:WD40 repeat domain-containing protein [Leptolyngbya ectocarpi]MBE9069223.1 WD40 repeat domain-containing protein [Leptolyngbya cf. ectocarpi LEGE 11479]
MPKQILTQLSTHTVHLGTGHDQFEVMVNNLSDRFATFALELSASGVARQTTSDWYRLTPDLSAKIPAGDHVNFVVNILEPPPIPGGFTGKMNLNVNVTCLELGEEDRQLINLVVAGSGVIPPTLKLPITDFQTVPGDLLEIPLQLYNANRNTANIRLALKGLPKAWLNEGHERRLQVASQGSAHGLFLCQPPLASEAKVYPFHIEVSQAEAPIVRQSGTLTVLPTGWVEFTCTINEADKTDNAVPLETSKKEKSASLHHTLDLNNQSNVRQAVAMTLNRIDIPWQRKVWAALRRRPPTPSGTTSHILQLSPAQVDLKAGDRANMKLTLSPVSPWLGWQRRQQFQLRPQLQQTEIRPPTQTVELLAKPKIPFWTQCLGIGGVCIAALTAIYWPTGHRGAVNSVQFDGQANAIISGADDHTLHRWQVSRRLRDLATLKDTDKAIRVVRYRPRNNDLLAAGLENGEIQLWDFLSQQPPKSLVFQRDDRVFDLRFSHDSQTLLSAHGSGLVLHWAIDDWANLGKETIPKQQQQFGFAVQAIAPITYTSTQTGDQRNHLLAVGGRFNRLVLWDFETDRQQILEYPPGEPNHYLSSLDTAADNSTRLAAADNQGRITLWNLAQCLKDGTSCKPSDRWEDGHQGKPINTVALSKNACYLVSGGDDGRVMLWSLNTIGQVMARQQLAQFSKPVNSVDILQQEKTLLVVSGSDTHRVKLHRTQANNKACPGNPL